MSSERGGANQQINMQTFYPTNIAPQPSAKAGTFGTVWGYVESLFAGTRNSENDIVADDGVQNMNIVSDTLFVVAGCYYEHDYWQEYDSSDSNQPSRTRRRNSVRCRPSVQDGVAYEVGQHG